MAVYLFLDSRDSLTFHPTNTPGDFIVTLPKRYILSGRWECALMELTMHFSDDVSQSRVYVCCDIVVDSYVRNTMLPILRAQDVAAEQRYVQNTYTHPIYLDVSTQELSDIRIYIRNDRMQTGKSNIEYFNCVLCLREKKKAMALLEAHDFI